MPSGQRNESLPSGCGEKQNCHQIVILEQQPFAIIGEMETKQTHKTRVEDNIPVIVFGAVTTKEFVKEIISVKAPSQPSRKFSLITEFVSYGAAVTVTYFLANFLKERGDHEGVIAKNETIQK
jgi:hypothetical protein